MEKEQRKIRLSLKPNLINQQFLKMRRIDWYEYLTKDIINQNEYNEGLNKWIKEDKIGASEFINKHMPMTG